MTRNYRKPNRYSENSTIARHNERDRERWGEVDGRDDQWDQESLDALLEGFLVEELSPIGAKSLYTKVRRTRKGQETQLQKFGIAYGDKEKAYHPQNRTDRTGLPITKREVYLIRLAVNASGRRRGAHHADYLARVLARDPADMQRVLKQLAINRRGFNVEEKPQRGETEVDLLARQIADRLQHMTATWAKGVVVETSEV